MYSFRRTAITEMRRTQGTEIAKELAAHRRDGDAIYTCDHESLAYMDISAVRSLGSGLTRQQISEFFRQSNLARGPLAESGESSLLQKIEEQIVSRLRGHDEYVAQERALNNLVERIGVSTNTKISLRGHGAIRGCRRALKMCIDDQSTALTTGLDGVLRSDKREYA
ncbi:hypothetical protein K469DRAFT_705625 [Zopfia rhizophila CBS 207.26]|uniref:Uncharacterized protein n=1 Tax=Zopfia rhizophila CBS 207.26 TaxID=1314779 RepID=A0A6A6E925_9PEZI|nr:hypothetical protein K469DRAFT_705625 [Zopfia rhizophila CBS 207.26]